MAFRRVPMARGEEQRVAPAGEYKLVIRKVDAKKTKKGADMDVFLVAFADEPNYMPFSHFVTFPSEDDQYLEMRVRDIRRLCHVFDVPYTDEGYDSDDFLGAEGTCNVEVEVYEAEGKEPRESNRLVLPRVKG